MGSDIGGGVIVRLRGRHLVIATGQFGRCALKGRFHAETGWPRVSMEAGAGQAGPQFDY